MSEEMTRSEGPVLPAWREPSSLGEAKVGLWQDWLTLNERAYLSGKRLLWIKSAVPRGEFLPWIEENAPFSQRTAYNFMGFVETCEKNGRLMDYEPKKLATVASSGETPPLPEGKFPVMLADPAWRYQHTEFDQSAENVYPTMSIEELCDLPVSDLAWDDSVLFLWVTVPMKRGAFKVLESWGFDYKSTIFWIKDRHPGMGFWVKGYVEELWVCKRGTPGLPEERPVNILFEKVTKHSKKPEQVYGMIESMFSGPYVELFARETRDGWESWGNEVDAAVGADEGGA